MQNKPNNVVFDMEALDLLSYDGNLLGRLANARLTRYFEARSVFSLHAACCTQQISVISFQIPYKELLQLCLGKLLHTHTAPL